MRRCGSAEVELRKRKNSPSVELDDRHRGLRFDSPCGRVLGIDEGKGLAWLRGGNGERWGDLLGVVVSLVW